MCCCCGDVGECAWTWFRAFAWALGLRGEEAMEVWMGEGTFEAFARGEERRGACRLWSLALKGEVTAAAEASQ